MKRVLLVMYNALDQGGIQNVMMNTVRSLHGEYVFDALVLSLKNGFYDAEFLSYGGRIVKKDFFGGRSKILNRFKFYLRGNFIYKNVKKMIRENGPYAAIHCHIADEAGIALRAAKKCGIPIRIAHAHTAFEKKNNPVASCYISHLKKLIAKNATDCVACSQKAGEKLFGTNPFQIVYNTVDQKFLQFKGEHKANPAPVLLQVGLICDNKNQSFTVRVFAELKKKYPASVLHFIGAPKDAAMQAYFDALKEESARLGVLEAISFLPADSDVFAELQQSDYVMFPSKFEGLGIVPVEAQAQGVKCFVSDTVPREIDCGGCIFLNLADGADFWADRIAAQFESDRGQRERYDISRFRPEVIMEQYRTIYHGELK